MENKDKIFIVGDPNDERIRELVSKLHNVEIMPPQEAEKVHSQFKRIDFPITPPPVIDIPTHFTPPITRAERRKLSRKK